MHSKNLFFGGGGLERLGGGGGGGGGELPPPTHPPPLDRTLGMEDAVLYGGYLYSFCYFVEYCCQKFLLF